MLPFMPCAFCAHSRAPNGGTGCAAYPSDIPMEILTGRVSHRVPRPGDGGIQFEFAENTLPVFREAIDKIWPPPS